MKFKGIKFFLKSLIFEDSPFNSTIPTANTSDLDLLEALS